MEPRTKIVRTSDVTPHRTPLLICVIASCAIASDLRAENDAGVALPRYRLAVGQELVYRLTACEDFRESNGDESATVDGPRDQMEWRVFVVGQNGDGSWRVFIRTKITFVNRDGSLRAKRDSLGYCDLQPDGVYQLEEKTAVFKRLIPDELFCRLPASEAELAQGWTSNSPVLGYSYTFRVEDQFGPVLRFVGVEKAAYAEMHQWQTTKRFDFNRQRGVVEEVNVEFKRLAEGKLRDRRTIELISLTQRDSAWLAAFHHEAETYLDVLAKWHFLVSEAHRTRTPDACQGLMNEARGLLVTAREQATVDVLQELYDAHIQSHEDEEQWAANSVTNRNEFFAEVPSFATNWEAMNLDGSKFRLADHRGRVLILYFWTTSCEYCVLSAPQVRQLAAEYQGKEVAVVGMFVGEDRDNEDEMANYLITNSYQGLPHLDAKEIAAQYRLRQYGLGYPSLLILDQSGTVHDVFVGYSADLGQRVRNTVDRLLNRSSAEVK